MEDKNGIALGVNLPVNSIYRELVFDISPLLHYVAISF